MAAPSHVFTIARVAKMLGEDEAWLEEIAMENGARRRSRLDLGRR
jgi:hypothetical protein